MEKVINGGEALIDAFNNVSNRLRFWLKRMIEFIHKGAYFGCSCIHGWLFLKQHLQLFQVLFNRLGILGQHLV